MITIELPLPDSKLSPNRKNGKDWRSTITAKKAAINYGYALALEAAKGKKLVPDNWYSLCIVVYEPTLRSMDIDNRLSSLKHSLDGVCKALGIDDKQFNPVAIRKEYRKGSGGVLLSISEVQA